MKLIVIVRSHTVATGIGVWHNPSGPGSLHSAHQHLTDSMPVLATQPSPASKRSTSSATAQIKIHRKLRYSG